MSKDFNKFLDEQLKDADFKKEYEALGPEVAIARAIIEARRDTGMTQKDLSEATGVTQADISRIENGTANPSLKTLNRVAAGLGKKLEISFI